MFDMKVERRGEALLVKHVDVDVRGILSAELRDDHRTADDALGGSVHHDEDVGACERVALLPTEAAPRQVEQVADRGPIGRQVHRVEVVRHAQELVFVAGHGAANLVRVHRPRLPQGAAGAGARCFDAVRHSRAAQAKRLKNNGRHAARHRLN
jgi:hypothetical protein